MDGAGSSFVDPAASCLKKPSYKPKDNKSFFLKYLNSRCNVQQEIIHIFNSLDKVYDQLTVAFDPNTVTYNNQAKPDFVREPLVSVKA